MDPGSSNESHSRDERNATVDYDNGDKRALIEALFEWRNKLFNKHKPDLSRALRTRTFHSTVAGLHEAPELRAVERTPTIIGMQATLMGGDDPGGPMQGGADPGGSVEGGDEPGGSS